MGRSVAFSHSAILLFGWLALFFGFAEAQAINVSDGELAKLADELIRKLPSAGEIRVDYLPCHHSDNLIDDSTRQISARLFTFINRKTKRLKLSSLEDSMEWIARENSVQRTYLNQLLGRHRDRIATKAADALLECEVMRDRATLYIDRQFVSVKLTVYRWATLYANNSDSPVDEQLKKLTDRLKKNINDIRNSVTIDYKPCTNSRGDVNAYTRQLTHQFLAPLSAAFRTISLEDVIQGARRNESVSQKYLEQVASLHRKRLHSVQYKALLTCRVSDVPGHVDQVQFTVRVIQKNGETIQDFARWAKYY